MVATCVYMCVWQEASQCYFMSAEKECRKIDLEIYYEMLLLQPFQKTVCQELKAQQIHPFRDKMITHILHTSVFRSESKLHVSPEGFPSQTWSPCFTTLLSFESDRLSQHPLYNPLFRETFKRSMYANWFQSQSN